MRLPNAPAPLLGPTGRTAAVSYRELVALVDTATGERIDLTLPKDGEAIAIARDDSSVAVVSGGRVGVVARQEPAWSEKGSASLRGSVYRAALGKKYLAAAVRTGEHALNLCVWRIMDGALETVGPEGGMELGATGVFHFGLDETNGRILLAGQRGKGAFDGSGTPFAGVVAIDATPAIVWKGEGIPFQPHGYLFPLEGGKLAIHTRERLATLSLDSLPEVEILTDDEWPTPLERAALSPDGTIVAWTWGDEDDRTHLRAARLGDPTPLLETTFTLDGNFPALAVDDKGNVTVVAGKRPDQMVIVRVAVGGEAIQDAVVVPSEPDD